MEINFKFDNAKTKFAFENLLSETRKASLYEHGQRAIAKEIQKGYDLSEINLEISRPDTGSDRLRLFVTNPFGHNQVDWEPIDWKVIFHNSKTLNLAIQKYHSMDDDGTPLPVEPEETDETAIEAEEE